MKQLKKITLAACIAAIMVGTAGCARIDDSEVGVRRTFGGQIENKELGTGWHQVMIGDVILFAAKEIMIYQSDLTPQSKDKSVLADFDINFTYTVSTAKIAEYYKRYSGSSHLELEGHEEIYPMGNVVKDIVRAATYSAVAEYAALEINNNRAAVEERIIKIANSKLTHEGLSDIKIKLVNVRNIALAPDVVESANRVVKSENDLATKKNEVLIADQEAKRISALAAQSGNGYVELLRAQADKQRAEAMIIAAEKGSTVWIVPQNFTGLGNIQK
jgi:regulator of protease activity HflC (stomatin/prohibitin superfamily)